MKTAKKIRSAAPPRMITSAMATKNMAQAIWLTRTKPGSSNQVSNNQAIIGLHPCRDVGGQEAGTVLGLEGIQDKGAKPQDHKPDHQARGHEHEPLNHREGVRGA